MHRNKAGGRGRQGARPLKVAKARKPTLVDSFRHAERELDELLPKTSLGAIPAAGTEAGKHWRAGVGTAVRKRIFALTNRDKYPAAIVARAWGLLRAFQNRVAEKGHDQWWVEEAQNRGRARVGLKQRGRGKG